MKKMRSIWTMLALLVVLTCALATTVFADEAPAGAPDVSGNADGVWTKLTSGTGQTISSSGNLVM